MKKQLDDQDKARKAAVMTSVVEETKALVTANKQLPWLVRRVQAYSNTKVRAEGDLKFRCNEELFGQLV